MSMLSPKRTKFRKFHKGHLAGKAKGGDEVSFGDFGMQVLEPGWITARQLEAARVAISSLGQESRARCTSASSRTSR
jgi:large subunit ribosomal protein L16